MEIKIHDRYQNNAQYNRIWNMQGKYTKKISKILHRNLRIEIGLKNCIFEYKKYGSIPFTP